MSEPDDGLEPFRPAWWLPGGHLQTLGGRFLRRLETTPMRVTRLELADGDFVDLHESHPELPENSPLVLVLHGLEGSSRANYVASLARELAVRGIRAIRLNFRACSGEMNRLPRFYHAGDTADLRAALAWARDRHPHAPIGAVGFSLGGNVLLKYLGEVGANAHPVEAAAAISVPFDLAAGTRQLERPGMGWIYSRYFMRKLRAKALAKRTVLGPHCDVEGAIVARTVRRYDDLLTARLHGFADAWDYYRQSSSVHYLHAIRTPTLLLHSLNDPFLPAGAAPADVVAMNPNLVNGFTPHGGHVGFVSGAPWRVSFWAERQAARFLAARLCAGRQQPEPNRTSAVPESERRSPVTTASFT